LRVLDRYLGVLTLAPLTLSLAVMVGTIWLLQALRLGQVVVGAGALATGQILLYSLPSLLVFAFPLALFGAVLFVLARLAGTGQLQAMGGLGLAPWRLTCPLLGLASLAAAATFALASWGEPAALSRLSRLLAQSAARVMVLGAQERQFISLDADHTLFFQHQERRSADQVLFQHAFLASDHPAQQLLARQALVTIGPTLRLELRFCDGELQMLNAEGGLRRVRFKELRLTLDQRDLLRPFLHLFQQGDPLRSSAVRALSCLTLALWAVVLGLRRMRRGGLALVGFFAAAGYQVVLWGAQLMWPGAWSGLAWAGGAGLVGLVWLIRL
jgi:lipopolysaccharide export LptBFGC system permease protein LptF